MTLRLTRRSSRRYRDCLCNTLFVVLIISLIVNLTFKREVPSPEEIIRNITIFEKLFDNETKLDCNGDPLASWCANETRICDLSIVVYDEMFVITRLVIIKPDAVVGKRLGGERVQDVLNQPEEDEFYRLREGFLQLPCLPLGLNQTIPHDNHINIVLSAATGYQRHTELDIVRETTIAVNRYDYSNLYHTINDLYTTYILCRFVGKDPKSVRILFLDAHPKGNLDIFWSRLFHSYRRLGRLKNSSAMLYREMIWAQPQDKSELNVEQDRRITPSYFFEFRQHIIDQFQVYYSVNDQIHCRSLHVFLLLRHNYVAHARNPSGRVLRQFANEDKLLSILARKFSNHSNIIFTYDSFEQLPIQQQINILSETDIFVGMNGAGLTNLMFLSSNRYVVELVTSFWDVRKTYALLASVSKINYRRCLITEESTEQEAETIYNCILERIFALCP